MKKIEPPHWYNNPIDDNWTLCFDRWFDEITKGKILIDESDLVEVKGQNNNDHKIWCTEFKDAPYKAYLIKSSIEPIKRESLEDVARELLLAVEKAKGSLEEPSINLNVDDYLARLGKALEVSE